MPERTSSLHTATDAPVAHRIQLRAGVVVSWRAVVVAALLSLVLGFAYSQVLTARNPSLTTAARHRLAPPQHGLSSLPLTAQGPISGALGAEDPAYRIGSAAGGFQAASPAQRMKESFDPSGVLVSSGNTQLGLSLRAAGYGTSLQPLGAASPRAKANRVTYSYPGLSEWYLNGPLGLEQGFTITRALSGRASAPLTLSLALSGDAHVALGKRAQSLTLINAGGPPLRYGGLRVSDARGRTLHSWLELRAGGVLLRANTRGARYPLRIDPFIQQGEKFVGTGQAGNIDPHIGFSVALSSNGSTALIGGPGDYGKTGAAWVFTRSMTTWTQQGAKLTAKLGEQIGEGEFGRSVALSSEGSTALIGGQFDNSEVGAAWVFTRSSEGVWSQQGSKLTAKAGEEIGKARFGESVALSPDGNTALIGGPKDNKGLGAEWAFLRSGGVWAQQGSKLTGSGEVSEEKLPGEFGTSAALTSTEGNTALIGGPGDNKGLGATWAFTRSGGVWTPQGSKLTAKAGEEISSETAPGEFGSSVALSSEGAGGAVTALIGASGDNKEVGAAWAFTRSTAGVWSQQTVPKLTGTSEIGAAQFGSSVALSSEGAEGAVTALIGGPADNTGVSLMGIGAAWVFTRSGAAWTQQAKLTGGSETGEGRVGEGVALSSDGNTALLGGPLDSTELGAAWAFTRVGTAWSQQAKLAGMGAAARSTANIGASVALSSEGTERTVTALIGAPGDGNGAAWVFTRSPEGVWTQQGPKLTGGEEIGPLVRFGSSVALSPNGNTALIGGSEENSEKGAAWVFTRSGSTWGQQGPKLTGGEETEKGLFGSSVALSSEGAEGAITALIGGPMDGPTETEKGAAWVFTRLGTTWAQQAKLLGEGVAGGFNPRIGSSVALSSNGNTALIGGPDDNNTIGAAWAFTRSGTTWAQQAKLTGSEGVAEGQLQGASVALSSEGNTALIGGPADNALTGAAWAFTRSGSTWTQQGSKLTATGETGPARFGEGVALSSDGNTAVIGGPYDSSEKGAAWVFTRLGSTWSQPGSKLTGTGANGVAQFGKRVALSPSGRTALIGGLQDYGGTGAAWAFLQSTPTVVIGGATEVTHTTATLNATVNPGGGIVTDCHFEYGTTSYEVSKPCTPSPGSGESPVAVSASLTGLAVNTTYKFRISATNAGGTQTGESTFPTLASPPTTVTAPASAITQTSATLNATVNPNDGEVTDCHFEYGTTTTYGTSVACSSLPGSGGSPVAVSQAIAGLTASTTYHFRISAKNPTNTELGGDQTFFTTPPPAIPPHYFSNGAKLKESAGKFGEAGVKEVIGWGTVELKGEKGAAAPGALKCHEVTGGSVSNPVGGGAGEGATQALVVFDCESNLCKEAGTASVLPEKLPWLGTLAEGGTQGVPFRARTPGVKMDVTCAGASAAHFKGEYAPLAPAGEDKGTTAGHPGFLSFGAGSGELEEEEQPGSSKTNGALKVLGYTEQELIQVK